MSWWWWAVIGSGVATVLMGALVWLIAMCTRYEVIEPGNRKW